MSNTGTFMECLANGDVNKISAKSAISTASRRRQELTSPENNENTVKQKRRKQESAVNLYSPPERALNDYGLRVARLRVKIPKSVSINWAFGLFTPQPETRNPQRIPPNFLNFGGGLWVNMTFVEVGWAAGRTKGNYFSAQYCCRKRERVNHYDSQRKNDIFITDKKFEKFFLKLKDISSQVRERLSKNYLSQTEI